MALHYLLDGYNITQQISSLMLKGLQSGREGLVKLIERYHPQGSRQNLVTIVFDGQPGVINPGQGPADSSIKVVFSEGESADDKIRKIISASPRKKEMVVVTDDKELRFSVRALGAKILTVQEFLSKIKPRSTAPLPEKGKKKKDVEEKSISHSLEFKITDELKRIWLKEE